ncbi:hypothetical protein CDAR_319261 [Caerostris darwini]|uniref:Uncharacterized protein n=1 Tax=Caerostris darwini TaxID=1538125 RepID=A0AAV4TV88_9ARAC|nr:hypothetical protein CDAR_319261 [Caerostris darwini]
MAKRKRSPSVFQGRGAIFLTTLRKNGSPPFFFFALITFSFVHATDDPPGVGWIVNARPFPSELARFWKQWLQCTLPSDLSLRPSCKRLYVYELGKANSRKTNLGRQYGSNRQFGKKSFKKFGSLKVRKVHIFKKVQKFDI